MTSSSFLHSTHPVVVTRRGGFGEVYGCRKADTGKMYAMKCLDKKRIKMKQGETLALNERIMLSLVSGTLLSTSLLLALKVGHCPRESRVHNNLFPLRRFPRVRTVPSSCA